jgi:acetyl-CoA acetyltransferase
MIRVAASVLGSEAIDMHGDVPDTTGQFKALTSESARRAYEQAGFGPSDCDSFEVDDRVASAEPLHYESLGICTEGEVGRLVDEARTSLGGDIPVNTSGGLLARGDPSGATGIAGICELVWQMRGQAGARQVEGHRAGLAHALSLGTACTIHILQA